ncbi:MAG: diaminopimelate decarboxylase [Rhodospirillales bacterium]|nr:diaminopimelate decarboxylase [Rhodospirillales bacterium]
MKGFTYRGGRLHADAVELDVLAETYGTPLYVYSATALEAAYDRFQAAFRSQGLLPLICYAMKANSNQAVVTTFAQRGAGADIVSEGELHRALAAGVAADKIVFAGVGKTAGEIRAALKAGIYRFNAESLPELETLAAVADEAGCSLPVALRINPDVDAKTHEKIATGKAENKFGVDLKILPEVLELIRQRPGLRLCGLAVHIGSQLVEIAPYRAAFACLAALYRDLKAEGWPLESLDLGGGLGISYRDETPPTPEAYAEAAAAAVAGLECDLICEPGRHLVGAAGILLAKILYVKQGSARRFLILDAAMNDLIRPTLYEAWHELLPVRQPAAGAPLEPADVVGPICESGDYFARARPLPPLAAGEAIALSHAGAYGAVMASTYNSRPPAAEVMVRGGDFSPVRPRLDYATLIARDCLPEWLRR